MKALICGITGQDGSYLAKFLLSKNYEVYGTSRDAAISACTNLDVLSIKDKVVLLSMAPNDFRSVLTVLERSEPDEIYYLASQSSVGLSFEQPAETLESIVNGVLNILEAIRLRSRPVRFYNASSSECFGDTGDNPADESTPFYPQSPYAVAKCSAHWLVANYRKAYGLHASSGILFNHESPLRPRRFVTQKIIQSAKRIAAGSDERLLLGRLDIKRDWGWAPEYVEAMWRMLQVDTPLDMVIATGKTNSLEEFVEHTFTLHDLDWKAHVDISSSLTRPSDITTSHGNPAMAEKLIGWKAHYFIQDIIAMMTFDYH